MHAFLHPTEKRKAPKGWWTKAPQSPQAAQTPKKAAQPKKAGAPGKAPGQAEAEVPLAQLAQRAAQRDGGAPALAAAAEHAQVALLLLPSRKQCDPVGFLFYNSSSQVPTKSFWYDSAYMWREIYPMGALVAVRRKGR